MGRAFGTFTWTAVDAYPTAAGGLNVFYRDITAEKKRSLAVTASEQKFADVLRLSPAGIALMCGPNFVFENVNRKFTELVSPREYLGRSFSEAFPELVDSELLASKAQSMGADGYIRKPVELNQMLSIVSKMLPDSNVRL